MTEPKEQLRPEGPFELTGKIEEPFNGWNGKFYEHPKTRGPRMYNAGFKAGQSSRSPEVDGKWEKLRELYEWIKLVHKDWVNTGKFEKAYACEYILNYIESVATVAILKTGSSTVPTRDAERGKP